MTALYVIIDPEHCAGRDPLWVAERALRGGAGVLQLRAKTLCDRERLTLARSLRALTREHGVPLWINDRADLALLAQADGLHLGQSDFPPAEVQKLVGSQMQLGLSTHSAAQVQAASSLDVNLLGFGPIFSTKSKARPDPEVGPEGLATALALTTRPVVAIGGITSANVAHVAKCEPAFVAVISAVCGVSDPEAAARELVLALG